MQAAIYVRISRDHEGAGLGVDRQEQDCHALAERLGWTVARVYTDNDISAYSGRTRPGYRAMLEAIRNGEIGAVLAWHTDRLHRRAVELEEFVTLAEAHHIEVQTVTSGTVDLSTASGRMVARMLGAAAQHEIDHARERMRSAKRQAATDGRHRGGPRPYGWESNGMTLVDAEADVLRRAARDVLAGRALAAIARDINAQGHRTSTGKPWSYATLSAVLSRPRNAALVSHGRSDRVDGSLEIVGPAKWAPIFDEDTWRALRTILADPGRRKQHGNALRWLGSGLYLCGLCGEPMRVAPYGKSVDGKPQRWLYRCVASAHLTFSTHVADEAVTAVIRARITDPATAKLLAHDKGQDRAAAALRERRAVLAARLAEFESDYAAGNVTGVQLARATTRVEADMAEVDRALAGTIGGNALAAVAATSDPGAAFDASPLEFQRQILAALATVTILPAGRGAKLGPDRIHFEWSTK